MAFHPREWRRRSDSHWSNIDGGDGFYFDRLGTEEWDTCFGIDRDNVVSKEDLDDGVIGSTQRCTSPGHMERFHLKINSHDLDFFWGSGSSYPSGEYSARGILTHEFGHASGWDEHWGDTGDNQLCPSNSTDKHTMCASTSPSTSWSLASLETHDIHTFENAYP